MMTETAVRKPKPRRVEAADPLDDMPTAPEHVAPEPALSFDPLAFTDHAADPAVQTAQAKLQDLKTNLSEARRRIEAAAVERDIFIDQARQELLTGGEITSQAPVVDPTLVQLVQIHEEAVADQTQAIAEAKRTAAAPEIADALQRIREHGKALGDALLSMADNAKWLRQAHDDLARVDDATAMKVLYPHPKLWENVTTRDIARELQLFLGSEAPSGLARFTWKLYSR